MSKTSEPQGPKPRFVAHLPDLTKREDYFDPSDNKKVRIRIMLTKNGIEIAGDSMYPHLLEKLLTKAGAKEIESVLCG
jgi:hypothetical protein